MIHGVRHAAALLFVGDIVAFTAALWLTLLLRYWELPSAERFLEHLVPFSFLFAIWILVYYVSGLYGKGVVLLKSKWPDVILKVQFVNVLIAALFFFLAPGVSIEPKTNLVIYMVVSLLLVFLWRLALYPHAARRPVRYPAALIAGGDDAVRLAEEVNHNDRYRLTFPVVQDPATLTKAARELVGNVDFIVADLEDPNVQGFLDQAYADPKLSDLTVIPFVDVYEEVFDRVPLATVRQSWFLRRSMELPLFYGVAKRAIDIVGGLLMGVITAIAIPFVYLAHRLEGPGPLFIEQERIGEGGRRIRVYKFRSMQRNDAGAWSTDNPQNKVTKTGAFLRQTSLDEFPQFINVLKGELSLIGPRSDIKALGDRLAEAIPYYNMRYLVTPGITGWAQINQKYEPGNISPQSIEETKVRLAYDFYYLQKRSLALDLVIALKTMKRMLFRVSSW